MPPWDVIVLVRPEGTGPGEGGKRLLRWCPGGKTARYLTAGCFEGGSYGEAPRWGVWFSLREDVCFLEMGLWLVLPPRDGPEREDEAVIDGEAPAPRFVETASSG